jgi:methyl-accepting chemotaxis protein
VGVVGVLLCAAAVGVGWSAAMRTVDRIGRVTARLSQGLSEADERLGRVESRINSVRSDLTQVRVVAETVAAENPELPRVRAKIEQILDSLLSGIDRANTIADSLQSVAAGLRTAADIVDQLSNAPEASVRIRSAGDTIDRAAEALGGLQARVEAAKSATAVQLTRDLVTLARESVAGSERLSDGLVAARKEIAVARGRTTEWRDEVAFWVYVTATANTLVWVWGGLGQLCLIGWGRGRIDGHSAGG